MKRSINTLLLVITIVLAFSQAESHAQFKFGGKSGGNSRSSSPSGRGSSRSFGAFSGGSKSSHRTSSTSRGSQTYGGFSPRGNSSKTTNTSGKGLQNHGSFNSGKNHTRGGLTFGSNSSSKIGHKFTNNTKDGLNWNNNHKVDTKDIKRPWISNSTSNSKLNGSKMQIKLGQWGLGGHHTSQHKNQHTTKHNNWQGIAKHLIHKNFHNNHWCQHRPAVCQWWNNYCAPIAHSHQHEVVVCNWHHITSAPIVHAGVQAQPVQWYLGMKGILLPGKGIGIDTVEPGSPAEQVGLQPGMVLINCNGIDMLDEAAMQQAVATSGGVLKMTLLSTDGSQTLEGVVQMTQVAAVSF